MNDVMKAIMGRNVDEELPLTKALGENTESSAGMPSPPGAPETTLSEDDKTVGNQLNAGDPGSDKKLAQGSEGSGDANKLGAGDFGNGSFGGSGPNVEVAGAGKPVTSAGGMSKHLDPYGRPGYDPAMIPMDHVSDAAISKAINESGSLALSPGVSDVSPRFHVQKGGHQCGRCSTEFSKALTVCPGCGVSGTSGRSTEQHRYSGVSISKSVGQSLQRPVVRMVRLAD